MRKALGLFVAAAAVLAIPVATAQAGQMTFHIDNTGNKVLDYIAAPGETNQVTASQAPGTFTLTDSGAPVTLQVGAPCTLAGNTASCTGTDINFLLGDGDDVANFTSTVVETLTAIGLERVQIQGESGNDTLTASAPANAEVADPVRQVAPHGVALYGESFIGATGAQNGTPQASLPADSPGNDTLTGGEESDYMYGGPGDDIEMGGGGSDRMDRGGCLCLLVGGPGLARPENGNFGQDTLSGGAGTDNIFGNEAPSDADAVDTIACGTSPGDSKLSALSDSATIGTGDVVDTDCETVLAVIACPPGGANCVGSVQITAISGPTGSTASAARSRGRKRVVLGKEKFTVPAGLRTAVAVGLARKKVRKTLRKRKSVAGSQTIKAKRIGKQRARFTLKK